MISNRVTQLTQLLMHSFIFQLVRPNAYLFLSVRIIHIHYVYINGCILVINDFAFYGTPFLPVYNITH